jgi:Fe-S oxidoreductase
MWLEESGTKINVDRSRELIATLGTADGAGGRIATACHFCFIMIDDGTKANQRDDVVVGDLAIHLVDALERGDQGSQSL